MLERIIVGRSTNGCAAIKINAMPLVEIPVNVNHVLILSNPLHRYHGARLPLAKLFVASGRLVMGTSLGDKIVIVIALLLLAVSWDYPRCATRRGPVGFAVVID